jgi:hypothetical protein
MDVSTMDVFLVSGHMGVYNKKKIQFTNPNNKLWESWRFK